MIVPRIATRNSILYPGMPGKSLVNTVTLMQFDSSNSSWAISTKVETSLLPVAAKYFTRKNGKSLKKKFEKPCLIMFFYEL